MVSKSARVFLFAAGDKRPEKLEEGKGGLKKGEKDALFPTDESEKNRASFATSLLQK